MNPIRSWIYAMVWSACLCGIAGCGHTGFVPMSEPAAPAPADSPLPVYASRDIGRPYRVLGYVFRTTEGHKSGLEAIDEHSYVLSPMSEEMTELRRKALEKGADAIVGLELFPSHNGWGQSVGFSVGGLAVKFIEQDAVSTPEPSPSEPQPAPVTPQPPPQPTPQPPPQPSEPAPSQFPPTDGPEALPGPPSSL